MAAASHMNARANARSTAAQILTQVIRDGRSAARAVEAAEKSHSLDKDGSLVKEMVFGSLRYFVRLSALIDKQLKTPLRNKDKDVYCLAVLGLYQMIYMQVPDHAAISETVAATRPLKKPWAKNLVNALLRNFQRERLALLDRTDANAAVAASHPKWLYQKLKQAWPEDYQHIVKANNTHAPMILRVNQTKMRRERYLQMLHDQDIAAELHPKVSSALVLGKGVPVRQLPGFEQGLVSVQDAAAQLAAELLAPKSGDRVLDACAAPGGKTAHLLEAYPNLATLWAVDSDASRVERIVENLKRLQLDCDIHCQDAAQLSHWAPEARFDRILLDAPCSATGVIRRQPDIKFHRRASDIDNLVLAQQTLLEALWPHLNAGGMLLYATCSVLPEENQQQISRFLASHADASEQPIPAPYKTLSATVSGPGLQILPGTEQMDGFFYCCLRKNAA